MGKLNKVFELHKNAFFGKTDLFNKQYTVSLHRKFWMTLTYCIKFGVLRNSDFAKYIINHKEMRKIKGFFNIEEYLLSSFINNGEFDNRLINEASNNRFRCWFVALTSRDNLEKLINMNIKELKPILAWICSVNKYQDIFERLNFNEYWYSIHYLVNYYNLPDYSHKWDGYIFRTPSNLNLGIFSRDKYSCGDLSLDIFKSKPTKSIIKKIYNNNSPYLDSFDTYKINKIEKYILNHSNLEIIDDIKLNYSEREIFENIEKAIEIFIYNNVEYFDCCISKFISIDPEQCFEIVKKYKPFLLYGNYSYDLNFLYDYCKVNPLYRYSFLYINILHGKFRCDEIIKYLIDDYVEYNLFIACLVSCDYSLLKFLYNVFKKRNVINLLILKTENIYIIRKI